MQKPIIFVHFSDIYYLKYTLRCARRFNPYKRVILLGDTTNKHYEKIGIEHHFFDDYNDAEEMVLFNRVFRFIKGRDYSNEYKARFMFKRMIYMYLFARSQSLRGFWTFDTDTLILTDLRTHEPTFDAYDYTEQCGGQCMNGLMNNLSSVKEYVDKVNELFQRDQFIEDMRQQTLKNPRKVLCDMDVYTAFKKEVSHHSVQLKTFQRGTTFDHCIQSSDNMQMYPYTIRDKKSIKQIYARDDGELFTFHLPTRKFIQLNSINMSFRMPSYIYRRILKYAYKKLSPKTSRPVASSKPLQPIELRENQFAVRCRKMAAKLRKYRLKLLYAVKGIKPDFPIPS